MNQFDVIIVGGGPTGVALGLELGMNKVKTLILEKHIKPLLSPRAQSLNNRSLEFFLRWNIADKLKQKVLLPPDYPIRGVWCSNLKGKTYAVSSSNEQLDDSISPERGIRIPLWLTEEVLRNRLLDFPTATLLTQKKVIDVKTDASQVLVTAINNQGQTENYQATYVIACDGANSITRRQANIPFTALSPTQRIINIVFEAPKLAALIEVEQGFLYYLLETNTPGAIGPVDLTRHLWYAQIRDKGEVDSIDKIDLKQLLNDMTGLTFDKNILQAHFWDMHIQLADAFSSQQRIFLVGDSAHAFVPTGGYGLNTGLGDVLNLGWKLAAVLKHAANPQLLDTYERERLPICLHNLRAAQKNADDMMTLRKNYDPKTDPMGFATANANLAKQHTYALGATMGYAYFDSPLTALLPNQSVVPMPQSNYEPISAPGYFLPHSWIDKQLSIYQVLSRTTWTFITCCEKPQELIDSLSGIFSKHQIPFSVLEVPANLYPVKFILIRPDWHIAYVANTETNIASELLGIVAWYCCLDGGLVSREPTHLD